VLLIRHDFPAAEEQARAALILEPDNMLAKAVLAEIEKAKLRGDYGAPPASTGENPEGETVQPSTPESDLHEFE
jgi:hypothetical protein